MEYLSEIICAILGAVAGSLLTFVYHKNVATKGGRNVNQSGSHVGGDQVAGDQVRTNKK